MIFIILFVIGALAVPVAVDISKHGSNNILRRSGDDLLRYPFVKSITRSLHIAKGRVSAVVLGVGSMVMLLFIVYVGLEGVALIGTLVQALKGW